MLPGPDALTHSLTHSVSQYVCQPAVPTWTLTLILHQTVNTANCRARATGTSLETVCRLLVSRFAKVAVFMHFGPVLSTVHVVVGSLP